MPVCENKRFAGHKRMPARSCASAFCHPPSKDPKSHQGYLATGASFNRNFGLTDSPCLRVYRDVIMIAKVVTYYGRALSRGMCTMFNCVDNRRKRGSPRRLHLLGHAGQKFSVVPNFHATPVVFRLLTTIYYDGLSGRECIEALERPN